jgi:hypothetical protein
MWNPHRKNRRTWKSPGGDYCGLLVTLFTPVLTGVLFYPISKTKDLKLISGRKQGGKEEC